MTHRNGRPAGLAVSATLAALALIPLPGGAAEPSVSDAAAAAPATTVATPAKATAAGRSAPKKDAAGNRSTAGARPDPKAAKQNEHIELDTTQITGNKELPKVMYVVPWKKSDLGDFGGKPAKSLLDEVLAPVDRDVFKRQTRYYDALQPDAAAAAPGPAAAGNEK